MKSIPKKLLDELISSAIYICKRYDYDEVSTALFQRRLMTDYDHAKVVMDELAKLKLIIGCRIDRDEEDDYENVICKVNKQKLKELNTN